MTVPPWHAVHGQQAAAPHLPPGQDEGSILAGVLAQIAALAAAAAGPGALPGSSAAARQAADWLAGLIQDYGPQILGTLAMAGCDLATAGEVSDGCSALGGAVQGGLSYLTQPGGHATLTGLLTAAASGAAQWAAAGIFGSNGDAAIPAANITNDTASAAEEGLSLPVHAAEALSNADARAFYLEGERSITALGNDLAARGVPARERALELISTRNALRTRARLLMADRNAAAMLDITDPNRTLRQLVSRAYAEKGLVGNDLWNYLAESASRSRQSVNERFGLQP